MRSLALRNPKSLWSYNPIPTGCVLYLPLWHPGLSGTVFKSPDLYRHITTVSGALYSATGRWFDGGGAADDIITVSHANAGVNNIFDGGGTILAWVNIASDGEDSVGRLAEKFTSGVAGWYWQARDEALGMCKIRFNHEFDGTDGTWTTTATAITVDTPTLVGLVYNSSTAGLRPTIYVNTTAITFGDGLTEDATSVGTRQSDAGKSLLIGNNAGQTATLDGYIMEYWEYDRALSAGEIAYVIAETEERHS